MTNIDVVDILIEEWADSLDRDTYVFYSDRATLGKRIEAALNEAEARGRKAGLEEAAKVAESHFGSEPISTDTRRIHSNDTSLSIARHIRALSDSESKDDKG